MTEFNENPAVTIPQDDEIRDISFGTRKKRFRIDHDDNRIVELDTSDLTLINRLEAIYPKLNEMASSVGKEFALPEDKELTTEEQLKLNSEALKKVDKQMRDALDELFDSNVSSICAPSGSMYDMFNGEFRFERIINVLSGLYVGNIKRESDKVMKRIKARTAKYTK